MSAEAQAVEAAKPERQGPPRWLGALSYRNIGAVAAESSSAATLTYRGVSVDGAQIQGESEDYVNFSTFDVERGQLVEAVDRLPVIGPERIVVAHAPDSRR